MSQAAVFGVSNFAVTTASAKSSKEATSRALALYRRWQKSVKKKKKRKKKKKLTERCRFQKS
jgi:NADH dehydrogenase (ubiquinone) 1 alpha subcomplex subunit 6